MPNQEILDEKREISGGKNIIGSLKERWESRSHSRMIVLIRKTLSDLYRTRGFVISIIIMVIFPIGALLALTLLPTSTSIDFGSASIYSAAMSFSFNLISNLYFWTLGICLATLVSAKSAGKIADEVTKGTMLMLVSKPISRFQIFLGKYIAVFLYGMMLSFFGIYITGWVTVLINSGNISHFIAMIPFLNLMFVYSLFVEFIFLTISMALSSIMKKGRTVGGLVLLLVLITYLVFYLIKTLKLIDLVIDFVPQLVLINYIDLGYHFGNVLNLLNNVFNILPPSTLWQLTFNGYTGIFDLTPADTHQSIELGGYDLNGYVDPVVSLLILVGLTGLLLLFGLNSLRKKEITN